MEDLTLSIQPRSGISLELEKGAILTPATDDKLGGIKTDSANGIYLDEERRLVVDRTDTEARQAAAQAQETADSAAEAAQAAQTSADNAQSAADTAQAKADQADTKADQAQADATQAKANAQQAMTDADDAKGAASSAQAVAGEAMDTANQARTDATQAKTDASNALTTAQAADSKADAAQSSADSAAAAAQGAQSTANTAQSTASDAAAAAATAATAAAAAQSTADGAAAAASSAATSAATAQSTAEAAQTAAAAAQSTADGKQDALVSGENIKTINDESILGAGNIETLTEIPAATDTNMGGVKTNPSQNIDLNDDGQLEVGGRLGQTVDLGLYNPVFADPVAVGRFSLLMSEAKGLTAAHRELIIAGGSGLTLKTAAAAGATEYRVSNTQQNRFVCACFVGNGSVLTLDEAYAKEKTVPIVSCQFANGGDVTAYFGATESNNDIVITTSESINPDSAITNIRCYGSWASADTISAGQGNRSGGGKILQIGASLFVGAGTNQVLQLGNRQYATKNNCIIIGNDMISAKQFWALIGQGHDTTRGGEGGAAFGKWSDITATTKLAVGNGTAYNARSNIFEVRDNAGASEVILKSPNKTSWKISVDDTGNLQTVQL